MISPVSPRGDSVALDSTVAQDQGGAPLALELGTEGLPPGPGDPVALSQRQLFFRRFKRHKLAIASLVVLIVLFVLCFSADLIADYPKGQTDLLARNESPSAEHWFGTDEGGKDVFTDILYGGQISLRIGIGVALVATFLGTTVGAVAGLYGKWIDQLLMRTTDLFLLLPAVAVLAVSLERFGKRPNTVVLVLAGLFWMQIARVVRGLTLSLKEKEFVEGARAAGASGPRIVLRHILPNCIGPIMVNLTLQIAVAIIAESTLSFLGFGVQRPDISWGTMLNDNRDNFDETIHTLLFPGFAILITVLCVNALGDGLRDAFDPHAKH
jgi:peptide/nickel transport system permease protein